MNEQTFWQTIEKVRNVEQNDIPLMNEILIEILSEYEVKNIIVFESLLSKLVSEVCQNEKFVKDLISEGFSITDDSLVYFSQWLIIQGKEFFNTILQNPDLLKKNHPFYFHLLRLPENEELSCAAEFAYNKRCELALEDHVSIENDSNRFLLLLENDYYQAREKIREN